jgi:MFS transporter, DHA1 family, multidrug resistance protein
MKRGPRANEHRLVPALFMAPLLPICMFWWGWTANDTSIHWIASIIAIGVFAFAAFVLMQCIFIYLPMSYPMYAASLFAANDFFRSAMAGGAIEFSRPLYNNLGVGRGISVMGGICAGCVTGVWALYYFGARLRARSKFAVG